MPGDMLDRNDNGKMDPIEFGEPMLDHPWICGGFPSSVTREGHGRRRPRLTGKEFYSDVHQPDIVYSDRMTLRFGGKTIELIFPGKNHANDGTAVLFHDERVLFTVDFPQDVLVQNTMRSLPSACGPFDGHPLADWIHSYRTLEALDFDVLLGRARLEDLHEAGHRGRPRVLRVPRRRKSPTRDVERHEPGRDAQDDHARASTRTGRTTSVCACGTSRRRTTT